jgi:hypothetical protein
VIDNKQQGSSSVRFFFAAILVILLGGAIAAGAYEAGLAQSAAQVVVPAASGAPVVAYYGRPYGFGFGFFPFGFLFPILGLFLFFALMRALVGGGRGYGHRGWYGDGVPSRFEEWHQRAHGETTPPTDRSAPPRQ